MMPVLGGYCNRVQLIHGAVLVGPREMAPVSTEEEHVSVRWKERQDVRQHWARKGLGA